MIIKIDNNTYKKITTTEEIIDVRSLKEELVRLEAELKQPEPSNEELIEFGKAMHPYYRDKDFLRTRISQLKDEIKQYG